MLPQNSFQSRRSRQSTPTQHTFHSSSPACSPLAAAPALCMTPALTLARLALVARPQEMRPDGGSWNKLAWSTEQANAVGTLDRPLTPYELATSLLVPLYAARWVALVPAEFAQKSCAVPAAPLCPPSSLLERNLAAAGPAKAAPGALPGAPRFPYQPTSPPPCSSHPPCLPCPSLPAAPARRCCTGGRAPA